MCRYKTKSPLTILSDSSFDGLQWFSIGDSRILQSTYHRQLKLYGKNRRLQGTSVDARRNCPIVAMSLLVPRKEI